jgi:hypothetical protein
MATQHTVVSYANGNAANHTGWVLGLTVVSFEHERAIMQQQQNKNKL